MKSEIRPENRFLDFLVMILTTLALMAVFYLIPANNMNLYTAPLLFLLFLPTVMALIHGAPFVPTPMEAVDKMLSLAKVKKGNKVYDIGCGDGRMVYVAANKYHANAVGYELSPLVYALARLRHVLWKSKGKIVFGNFKSHDFSDADVIVCYLLPDILARLQPKFENELKKGAKVVSYAFPVGNWIPSHCEERNRSKNLGPIWVYEMK